MRITRASHGIAQIISCEVRIALALLFAHQKYTHPPLLRSVLNSKWIKVTRFVILRLSYPVSGIWQQNNLNNYWDKMEKNVEKPSWYHSIFKNWCWKPNQLGKLTKISKTDTDFKTWHRPWLSYTLFLLLLLIIYCPWCLVWWNYKDSYDTSI